MIPANIILYFFLILIAVIGFGVAVIWPTAAGFYGFSALLAVGGFGVAVYIFSMKRHHRQLVCPVGSDCGAVVTSRYARFLGVPLEYWGMCYYAVIGSAYLALLATSGALPGVFLSGIILLSTVAFSFSCYLLFVQAFLLRQWCIWCLLSAALSITIFIIALSHLSTAVAVLSGMGSALAAVRGVGFVLGLGGATTAMVLFVQFLRDFRIDDAELRTLKGISELIWLGLFLALMSQFMAYIVTAQTAAPPGAFVVQTAALLVAAVSGAALMIVFTPLLAYIPFQEPHARGHHHSVLESYRVPVFVIGAVMLASWYAAFLLGFLEGLSGAGAAAVAVGIIAVAVAGALAYERRIRTGRRFTREPGAE